MARRGQPPKPTAVHKLEGTLRPYHGQRRDPVAPGSLSTKSPPTWMSDTQREMWMETLLDAPRDVLARIDWQMFASYIELADRHQRAVLAQRKLDDGQALPFLTKRKGGVGTSPYIRIINNTVLLMARLQSEMGFTPVARARLLRAPGDDPDNDPNTGWALLDSLRVIDMQDD
jgi:P27 family predicted phage terminase small subunit